MGGLEMLVQGGHLCASSKCKDTRRSLATSKFEEERVVDGRALYAECQGVAVVRSRE